jgi:hypothetical protein
LADPSLKRITLGGESDNNSFSVTGTWYMGTDAATIYRLEYISWQLRPKKKRVDPLRY